MFTQINLKFRNSTLGFKTLDLYQKPKKTSNNYHKNGIQEITRHVSSLPQTLTSAKGRKQIIEAKTSLAFNRIISLSCFLSFSLSPSCKMNRCRWNIHKCPFLLQNLSACVDARPTTHKHGVVFQPQVFYPKKTLQNPTTKVKKN